MLVRPGGAALWPRSSEPPPAGPPSSLPIPGITGATDVSVGVYSACAVVAGGQVQCWGSNQFGLLGDGSDAGISTNPVTAVGITDAVAVSVGQVYACALTSSGAVFCWGSDLGGHLGNGEVGDSAIPVPVATLSSGVDEISMGTSVACALLHSGIIECWGGTGAALGQGKTVTAFAALPAPIADP